MCVDMKPTPAPQFPFTVTTKRSDRLHKRPQGVPSNFLSQFLSIEFFLILF